MTPKLFFCITVATLFVACGSDSKKDPYVIKAGDQNTTDATTTDPGTQAAEVSLCSTVVTFVLQYGKGKKVAIDNQTDTTVIVKITNESTGGLVLQKCLWAGTQSEQDAAFATGDTLTIEVRQAKGQFWHWLCAEFTDEVLGNFPVCDTASVKIE